MQEWIGHIAAAIIGGVIILILAVIGWRGQHHAISATQYSAAKGGMLYFVEVMEEDLSNMGAGQTTTSLSAPGGYGAFVDVNLASDPYHVEFFSWTDRSTDIDPTTDQNIRVRYEWEETGTVQVKDPATNTYVPAETYLIKRFVNDSPTGESIDTLTEVELTFLDGSGGEITATQIEATPSLLRQVRAIDVNLRAVSPLGGGEGYLTTEDPALQYQIDQTRWNRVIRPINLTRITN